MINVYKEINLDNLNEVKSNLNKLTKKDWKNITKREQNLSESFIEKHSDKVHWDKLCKNSNLLSSVKEAIIKKLSKPN